jgi:hypothetical protein
VKSASQPAGPSSPDDWRAYRPAIWMVMLGIALLLVLNAYLGIIVIGAGLGIGLKIQTRRRRLRRADRQAVHTRRR